MAYLEVDPNSIQLDGQGPAGGRGGFVEVDPNTIKLDGPGGGSPSPQEPVNYGQIIKSGIKSGMAGAVDTIAELIDPTPMFGMDRVQSPIKPDLTDFKKSAQHIVDTSRKDYTGKGIIPAVAGFTTEAMANPLNYVGGRAAEGAAQATTAGAKILNAAIHGGTTGFVAPVGENDSRAANTLVGAATGGATRAAGEGIKAVAKGATAAASDAATGFSARTGQALDDASAALKATADASYKTAREAGAVISKPTGVNIANQVKAAIAATGKTNDRLHGDTLSVLKDFEQAVKGGNLGLEELDQFRQLFGDVVRRNTTKLEGSNADAMKASVAIDAIDSAVSKLGKTDILGGDTSAVEALNTARSQWSRFKKFDAIANVLRAADGDPNKIKSGLTRLANSKTGLRGFSDEERAAIKAAGKFSRGEWIAKGLGRFGFDPNNVFLPIVGGGIASAGIGTGAGAALTITATGARYLQKLLGRGKAENVLRLIESGGDDLQKVGQAVSEAAGPDGRKALTIIANNVADKTTQGSVRQQFKAIADKAGAVTKAAAPEAAKGISDQSGSLSPSLLKGGATLAGGLGAANFASSLATNTQYHQTGTDQPPLTPQPPASAPPVAPQPAAAIPANDNRPQGAVTPALVDKIIGAESSGRADARNKKSSALGAGQFINSTWLAMVEKYRPELMVGRTKKQVLDLRKDKALSREFTQQYAEDNAAILQQAGIPVSGSTVYLAHFLGPQTAVKLLSSDPRLSTASVVGADAINRNRSVLAGKRIRDVVAWAEKKVGGA